MKEYVPVNHPTSKMNKDEDQCEVEHMELASMAPKENMMPPNESFSFANSNSWI
jgi:hypothetical protein